MNKFIALVKKEIKEMLTIQVLLPMIITVLIFMFIGKVVGEEMKNTAQSFNIAVLDMDQSPVSESIVSMLEKNNFTVNLKENISTDELINYSKKEDISSAIVIPKGFESELSQDQPEQIEAYSILKNFSFTGSRDAAVLDTAVSLINESISNQEIAKLDPGVNPTKIKNPVSRVDHVVIGNKEAQTSPAEIMAFVSSQTTFIPIVLFIVIIFAATMIATAVATEKENKTLETLLTLPVSRKYIVSAKMVGAGIVALLSAVIYMFGFRSYMDGLSGGQLTESIANSNSNAISALGLQFSSTDYLILGGSLFLGILCALAIATILGAFAEDAKSVQGLISPLMVLIMIPYFLTMFMDVNSLSTGLKALVYAIPFSYPFMAAPNIFLDNYSVIYYGMIYQFILFVIFVLIASRIFSTDKIMTIKLKFGKRR